jgi:hypothetical protein
MFKRVEALDKADKFMVKKAVSNAIVSNVSGISIKPFQMYEKIELLSLLDLTWSCSGACTIAGRDGSPRGTRPLNTGPQISLQISANQERKRDGKGE